MTRQLKPSEILTLWRLAVAGGEERGKEWLKDIKPKVETNVRKSLKREGLIEEEKQKPLDGRREIIRLSITDKGWRWLGENLGAYAPLRSTSASEVLARILRFLKTFLDVKQFELADFIRSAGPQADHGINNLEQKIEAAYFRISGEKANVRVRLADLRAELPDVPRESLDPALLELAAKGRAGIDRLDNPLEIGPKDREAVLRTPSGEERHIIYINLGGFGS